MAKATARQIQQDTETRKGVLLVLALLICSMILGVVMHYLWQRHADQEKMKDRQTQYISLGEHVTTINGNVLVVKLSVEYVGQETEKALNLALPQLKGEVLRRMSQVQKADLRHLRTREGKQELADDLLIATRDTLGPGKLARNVKSVLFEKFLIDS